MSSVPETPLKRPAGSTSRKNLAVTQKAQVNPEPTSETNLPSVGNQKLHNQRTDRSSEKPTKNESKATVFKNRPLRTLRDFSHVNLIHYRNNIDFFQSELRQAGIKTNHEYLARTLTWAAELIFFRLYEEKFSEILSVYTRRVSLGWELNTGPTPAEFDDYLCSIVEKFWFSHVSGYSFLI